MMFRGVINGSESRIFRAGLLSLHQHFRKEKHLAFLCLVKPPFLTISMHRISGMPTDNRGCYLLSAYWGLGGSTRQSVGNAHFFLCSSVENNVEQGMVRELYEDIRGN